MKDKHKVNLPVIYLHSKCAEFNGLEDFEYLDKCSNRYCPLYYVETCPFMYQRALTITVKVRAEGDSLL